MLALLVAASLAAAPIPRSHAKADVTVFVPRVDRLPELVRFLERAGEKSALLRPSGWKSELHPFLWLDLEKPESFSEAGLSLEDPYTVSLVGGTARMACGRVLDVAKFEEKVTPRLNALGERSEQPGKVRKVVTTLGGHLRAGYAVQGDILCSFSTERDGEAFLAEAARRVEKPLAGPGGSWLSGLPSAPLYVLAPSLGAALVPIEGGVQVHARTRELPVPGLVAAKNHPGAKLSPSGLLFARGTLRPDAIRPVVMQWLDQVTQACANCSKSQLKQAATAIGSQLTGSFTLRVDRGELRGALQHPAARFFAVKWAVSAQLKDGSRLGPVLARIGKPVEGGYAHVAEAGTLYFGVSGKNLVLGNDATAWEALRTAHDSPAPMTHGLEMFVDPPALARTLSQVSLLDAMAVKELAGVFAASAELGPLLVASESLTVTDDVSTAGVHTLKAVWTLR